MKLIIFTSFFILTIISSSHAFANVEDNPPYLQENTQDENTIPYQNQNNSRQRYQTLQQQRNNRYHNRNQSRLYENDYYVGPYNRNGPWGAKKQFDKGNPNAELYMP